MLIYLAGSAGLKERDKRWINLMLHKLSSYFEWYKSKEIPYPFHIIKEKMVQQNKKVNLFLDSGAFSAYTQGIEIDIQEYIKFIQTHINLIEVYANLDKIHLTDKNLSASQTWQNQMVMEKAGLKPLPVFHYGEDEKWLKRYIGRGYEYIALGGMVKTSNLISWLDHIWKTYLTDSSGIPIIKVHGFGLTSHLLMFRYPWYSVDSTSWVVTGRLGSIYIPRYRKGQWVYNENSWKISVSNQSPNLKDAGQHITTLTSVEKDLFLRYIHEKGYKLGKSTFRKESQSYKLQENEKWAEKKSKDKGESRLVETIVEDGISNRYQLRDEMNIIYFLDLEKSMPKWPWPFTINNQSSLF